MKRSARVAACACMRAPRGRDWPGGRQGAPSARRLLRQAGRLLACVPWDAIRFIRREAATYDEAAVIAEKMRRAQAEIHASMPAGGCPGSMAKAIVREVDPSVALGSGQAAPAYGENSASNAPSVEDLFPAPVGGVPTVVNVPARLSNWPIQIKLAPVNAPYLPRLRFACGRRLQHSPVTFHEDFLKGPRVPYWLPEARRR